MRHWTVLDRRSVGGFEVIIEKSWEDMHTSECFDTSIDPSTGQPYWDTDDMCAKIDRGDLDWFIARARVLVDDLEIGDACIGGLLYEDARDFLTDGMGEDLIAEAVAEAQGRIAHLAQKFTLLAIKHSG